MELLAKCKRLMSSIYSARKERGKNKNKRKSRDKNRIRRNKRK
jgi:hypothetical protein